MKKCLINLKGVNLDEIIYKLGKDNIKIKNISKISNEEIQFIVIGKNFSEVKKFFRNVEATHTDLSRKNFKNIFMKFVAIYLALPIIISYAVFNSKRIYKIEINGLDQLTKNEIILILESNGVKQGKEKSVSAKEIEDLLLNNERIAQASCYFRGTTLIINISEKLVYKQTEYAPIVAKFDGVIYDYTITKGTLNFKVGDFVKAGDILVYPFVMDKFNNLVPVNPEATILARIYKSYTSTLNKYETYYEKSGKAKTYFTINFRKANKNRDSFKKPFVFYEEKVYTKCISDILPIYKQTIVYEELVEKKRENDLVLMQSENEHASVLMAENDNLDKTILLKKTYSVLANDCLFSTTTIVYEGDIVNG